MKIELAKWTVECGIPRTHVNKLLVLLQKCSELSYLTKDYRTLLKTVRNVETKVVHPGTYFHFGLKNGILRSFFHLSLRTVPDKIEIFVNIDGIPLAKSSNAQFWPILAMIRGLNGSKPFVVGIYYGSKKPTFANDYLRPFVDQALELESDGVMFRECKVSPSIAAFICDFPARAFITCVKSHCAYYGCPRCETKGSHFNPNVNNAKSGRVTYPQRNALPRTDESFRDQTQEEHHHCVSILEDLHIDMVFTIPLDPMHLTDLGVTRKCFVTWMKGKYRNVKLSRVKKAILSKRIEEIRPFIPDDFPRKLGPLDLMDKWKSTCFRLIKLRLGPVLLRGILPDNLYDHFLCFHVAMVLLSNEEQCAKPEIINYCSGLLKKFVSDSILLYGQQFVSANVHNLIHLPDDVRNFGSLDSFSA